jgi:hypothetical protein
LFNYSERNEEKYSMRKRKAAKNYSEEIQDEDETSTEKTMILQRKRKRGGIKIKRGINCSWTEEDVI